MDKIASFTVDHDKLEKGMYISRIDGDVVTYDIRMKTPNSGSYLENAAMHTIEHLFATHARNSAAADGVVYVGPMGCRTGFYLLLRDSVGNGEALELVHESMRFVADYCGDVPGTTRKECGNYLEHDLAAAKTEARRMLEVLENWNADKMNYAI